MAKDKFDNKDDNFFGELVVKEELVVKPVLQKARVSVTVKGFLKGRIRATDAKGNMYEITVNKDNSNLKVGDTLWI